MTKADRRLWQHTARVHACCYLEVEQRLSATDQLSGSVEAEVRHRREPNLPRVSDHLIDLAQVQSLVHLPECHRLARLAEVQRRIDLTQIHGLSELQLRADLAEGYRLVELAQADRSWLLLWLLLLGQYHLLCHASVLNHTSCSPNSITYITSQSLAACKKTCWHTHFPTLQFYNTANTSHYLALLHNDSNKLGGRPPQYAPPLWPWPLTLKVVSESRVMWATSVPILVFLGLSVHDLGLMYATDRRQTASSLNAPPPRGRGHNNIIILWIGAQLCSTTQSGKAF